MTCIVCNKTLGRQAKKYCSIVCQRQHLTNLYLQDWFDGKVDGFNDTKQCSLSKRIRDYVLNRAGHQCEECGWNKKHPITGRVPLDVHHVDGDSKNNRPENLKALCPNCHALTLTYKNLNRGRGRPLRNEVASK